MTTPTILDDYREIKAIATKEYYWAIVGHEPPGYMRIDGPITRITAYGEPDKYCAIAWFAVYSGDDIVARVPAGQCQAVWYVGEA